MKVSKIYEPVSCDLVDQIEILATERKKLEVLYMDGEIEKTKAFFLKTWITKNKEEFLVTESNIFIRLDQILSIDGKQFAQSCKI